MTESILSYARHTKSLGDDHSFHVACSMVLDIAHADLNEVAFESLRERLKDMLIDLEKHLSELNTSAVPSRAIPSPSLLVALLDLAARDPELVDETVVQTLNRIITGTVYGPTGSQASLQASHASLRATHYLDLRRAYGSRRPRRQNAVLLVNELDDLGLTLPSGNELQPAASTSPSSTT